MSLLTINRVCKECIKTREALAALDHEVQTIRLDYHELYEKVRRNLAKLAAREKAEAPANTDPSPSINHRSRRILSKRERRRLARGLPSPHATDR